MKVRELVRMLRRDGWEQVRQKSSHRIFKHPTKSGIVVVPDHGNHDLAVGTLRSIMKQAGLEDEL